MEMAGGRLTSVQLVEQCLDRIARYDRPYAALPGINAVVTSSHTAQAEAQSLDAERRAGQVRSPLHGVPILVKDNIDVAGMPTSGGNASLRNYRPKKDAFVTDRLRDAGAIIIGKTNLHEFAWASRTVSGIAGQTFNPYDQRRDPGGSSGGSAAAVAARFAPAALGTDTGGSLRIPAAHTNLVSMRPTFGLVSRSGVLPMTFHQDMVGPMAHGVEDVAALLDVIVAHDPNDRWSIAAASPSDESFLDAARSGKVAGKKIARLSNPDYRGSAAVETVLDSAVAVLRHLGAEVVDLELPQPIVDALQFSGVSLTLHEMRDAIDAYFAADGEGDPAASAGHGNVLQHPTFAAIVAGRSALATVQPWLEKMLHVDQADYDRRLARRRDVIADLSQFLQDRHVDALIYPSVRDTAPFAGCAAPRDNGQLSPLTGFPAITVPAGFTPSDLPVGIEFMGLPHTDRSLLGMARDFECATGHARRRPPHLGLD